MKRFAVTPLVLAAALFGGASQAQTVLTASSWIFPTHALSMAQKDWCDLLEKNLGQHEMQHPATRSGGLAGNV